MVITAVGIRPLTLQGVSHGAFTDFGFQWGCLDLGSLQLFIPQCQPIFHNHPVVGNTETTEQQI